MILKVLSEKGRLVISADESAHMEEDPVWKEGGEAEAAAAEEEDEEEEEEEDDDDDDADEEDKGSLSLICCKNDSWSANFSFDFIRSAWDISAPMQTVPGYSHALAICRPSPHPISRMRYPGLILRRLKSTVIMDDLPVGLGGFYGGIFPGEMGHHPVVSGLSQTLLFGGVV